MPDRAKTAIVLRYRDLVTELGGTIAEHRRILRQHGHVWWGWWRRQAEHVPRATLGELFVSDSAMEVPVLLFDSGTLDVFSTQANKAVVAPTGVGIHSPDFDATPGYYARGNYAVWFRLAGDISRAESATLRIVGTPTAGVEFDKLPSTSEARETNLTTLRDDRPTLWLAQPLMPE